MQPRVDPQAVAQQVRHKVGRNQTILGTLTPNVPIVTLDDMRASVVAERAQTLSGAPTPTVRGVYSSLRRPLPGVGGMATLTEEDRATLGNVPMSVQSKLPP